MVDPWDVRAFIYATVARTGQLPSATQTAADQALPHQEVLEAYRFLSDHHALVLMLDGETIRQASPFSGLPTSFLVDAGVRYWATCAWDMLGIPAALGQDVSISAVLSDDGGSTRLAVSGGRVQGNGELVHILRPAYAWYDNLIFT